MGSRPEDEHTARGKLDAQDEDDLEGAIERVRRDELFQAALKRIMEAHREVLDRLAET